MTEFEVKLVQSKIVDLSMNIAIEESTAVNIEATFSASVYEPKDDTDPTAMVKATCELTDSTKKLLRIECTAEMVFEINPVPENYADVLSKYSRDTIQKDMMDKISNIVRAMGHNLAIS